LKQQLACLAGTFFTAILISHLLKMMRQQKPHSGVAKLMTHTSLSPERVHVVGEASAVLQVITLQRQFSLADSLH
jgi:hypothetical protein